VSHCIDLIPGATLPNKAAYKLTPEQNEEIAQAQDFAQVMKRYKNKSRTDL
jgi:hypothetical protein